jgi:hypothetical protein
MARLIDPDDLIDTAGVAEVLGLASRSVVSVYRGRYPGTSLPRLSNKAHAASGCETISRRGVPRLGAWACGEYLGP